MRGMRIGIDVGGTFTDFVVVGTGPDGSVQVRRHKSPSTPADPAQAVVTGLRELIAEGLDVGEVVAVAHGTTIGLNAIIQRSGARVTLVATTGHRDLLEIGRSRMPRSFDLHAVPERVPVPRDRVVEIAARLGPDGATMSTPDSAELDRVAREVLATAPEAVALVVIEGFTDPAFEQRIAEGLQDRLEGLRVTAASAAWPEVREYERGLVAVLGAHIDPLMSGYFTRLADQLTGLGVTAPLFITASNGGSLSVAAAVDRPLDTVLSGPASGVTAAARILGAERDLITFDMGGTSSDMAIIVGGRSALTTRSLVGGLPLILPVVDVNAIGSGGGSLAWADTTGRTPVLRVGPRSAGALPGPACYGLGGTDATITDAYLVSGLIGADDFLGGEMPLYPDLAVSTLARLGAATGIGDGAEERDRAVAVADAVVRVATAQMATEVSKLLAQRGQDPAGFTLVPFGGAGPTHAALLAEEVGLRRVVVPDAAATFCAMGAAISPLRRDFARSLRRPLDAATLENLRLVLAGLQDQARTWIADNGGSAPRSTVRVTADMRYVGQAYEITVLLGEVALTGAPGTTPLDLGLDQVLSAFDAEHRRLYSFADPGAPVELATARLAVVGPDPELPVRRDGPTATAMVTGRASRAMRWHGRWHGATVAARTDVVPGHLLPGPALVEQGDTTIVVPPGWTASADLAGNLHLTREVP